MMDEHNTMDGPDQVLPSNALHTTDIEGAVQLRTGQTELSRIAPQSVPSLFAECAKRFADHTALAFKKYPDQKGFETITFTEYLNLTRTTAKAFLKLGLQRLNAVAILGFNSPEWFLSTLGAIHAGGVSAGIYTTNSAEATFYCLEHSKANIAVVEDQHQLDKVLKYRDKLPHLKAIVQYSGKPTSEGVMSWEELLAVGRAEDDTALEKALKRIAVNQCCTLIYTSGTTGNPKGVMLSHDNIVWEIKAVVACLDIIPGAETLVSYLPLSHIAALILELYAHIFIGATTYFANRDALKGGIIKTLLEVRPTRFLGVPRVWEKMAEKMKMIGAQAGTVKRTIATWAKAQGLQRNLDLMKGVDSPGFGYLIARSLIFSKVKSNLGFDRCKTFWTGAAPLAEDIKLYFASLDIPIMEGFGMSELSGVHTLNIESAFRFDSVGRSIPGVRTKIENPDEDKQGEICIYGRHVFMGYYNDEPNTVEALDADGWMRTGDVGKLDGEEFVYITGRIKELLITAGGENVAPVLIEQNMKLELPFISNCIVIGDRKKFLSILFTLSSEVDLDTTEPKDELSELSLNWLKELRLPFTTVSQVLTSGPDENILKSIQKGVDAANKKAISNAQKVQKFAILPKDFSIATGEIGPTLKLKRSTVYEKYGHIIDKLYDV